MDPTVQIEPSSLPIEALEHALFSTLPSDQRFQGLSFKAHTGLVPEQNSSDGLIFIIPPATGTSFFLLGEMYLELHMCLRDNKTGGRVSESIDLRYVVKLTLSLH